MKKFTFSVLLIISIAFIIESCGEKKAEQPKMTPIQYNDYIINAQSSIIQKFIELTKTFEKADAVEMESKLLELKTRIDSSITEITNLDKFEGNGEFKQAAMNLLTFYKSAVATDFKEMVDILKRKDKITPKDIERMGQLNTHIGTKEKMLDAEFAKAQDAFALKYNISIRPNRYQKEIDSIGK
ncbi:MAG: hypothetical protein WCT77_09160 [Bacteroidota bacterium]